ncbi:DUF3265 domain-containing protein [Vibrio sp. V38_P2S17PM301]|nr:DUF3265 domain-containing protein [Vibrio sp. V36_P2S2PM302]NAX24758.1 DUF3265 domain-containing protein [Vibrio sp. V38_P2S17PM301]NAX26714.1 DUF3265 domain-containing protein [Vibrio sp. V38_P2S17PM301]
MTLLALKLRFIHQIQVLLLYSTKSHNKQFKQIRNAWQFWFAVSYVFTAQCGDFCSALLTT